MQSALHHTLSSHSRCLNPILLKTSTLFTTHVRYTHTNTHTKAEVSECVSWIRHVESSTWELEHGKQELACFYFPLFWSTGGTITGNPVSVVVDVSYSLRSAQISAQRSAERSAQRSTQRSAQRSVQRSSQRSAQRSTQRSAQRSPQRSPQRSAQIFSEIRSAVRGSVHMQQSRWYQR